MYDTHILVTGYLPRILPPAFLSTPLCFICLPLLRLHDVLYLVYSYSNSTSGGITVWHHSTIHIKHTHKTTTESDQRNTTTVIWLNSDADVVSASVIVQLIIMPLRTVDLLTYPVYRDFVLVPSICLVM